MVGQIGARSVETRTPAAAAAAAAAGNAIARVAAGHTT